MCRVDWYFSPGLPRPMKSHGLGHEEENEEEAVQRNRLRSLGDESIDLQLPCRAGGDGCRGEGVAEKIEKERMRQRWQRWRKAVGDRRREFVRRGCGTGNKGGELLEPETG